MIQNDNELQATQERIQKFQSYVAQMKATIEDPQEFEMMSGSYRAEIEKMHREVMEYLATPLQKVSA